MDLSRFENKLQCICNDDVIFDVIDKIECDWGEHIVIQCPNCEELFSVDKKCLAFTSVLELLKNNSELYSQNEKQNYLTDYHPN